MDYSYRGSRGPSYFNLKAMAMAKQTKLVLLINVIMYSYIIALGSIAIDDHVRVFDKLDKSKKSQVKFIVSIIGIVFGSLCIIGLILNQTGMTGSFSENNIGSVLRQIAMIGSGGFMIVLGYYLYDDESIIKNLDSSYKNVYGRYGVGIGGMVLGVLNIAFIIYSFFK